MTATMTSPYKLESEASESTSAPPSAATLMLRRAAQENQVGAGVLSPKTGQMELPDLLVFTPIVPVDKTPEMVNGAANEVNASTDSSSQGAKNNTIDSPIHNVKETNESANKGAERTAEKSQQPEARPSSWMINGSTQLSLTKAIRPTEAAQPYKLISEEQAENRQIQRPYEDLHAANGRYSAHDANCRDGWKGAYSQLAQA